LAPEIPDALCPYVGLDAFQEENRTVFYGRQRLIDSMLESLRENRLLCVVGASGSGKSSLVRAGLVSTLKAGGLSGSETWHYYRPVVPGSTPVETLARLVQISGQADDGSLEQHSDRFRHEPNYLCRLVDGLNQTPAVVIIDQYEELVTLCNDDQERQAFIDNLICLVQSPGTRHVIILTMRVDFEAQVARLDEFYSLFEQSQVRVTAMNARELREAIVEPADKVGLRFEEGVVDALLRDILGEPAALPLLQFTLLKLWENRERNRITWEAYRRLGGGRLALARSADAFFEGLIPEEQVTARRILLRMVRPGEGLEVTSNRVRRESLYQAGEARDRVDRVLDRLIHQAHLVRLTQGYRPEDAQVEVAHEALVRNWPRLVEWLDEERENMRRRLRVTMAAEQWAAMGKDPGALLRGAALEEALRYEDLNELEAEFVRASQTAVEDARRKEEEARERELEQARALAEAQRRRAEAQARAARRLRVLVTALIFLVVLTIGATALTVAASQRAIRARSVAEVEATNAWVAQGEAIAAQSTAVAEAATAEAAESEAEWRLVVWHAEATLVAAQATVQQQSIQGQLDYSQEVAVQETAQSSKATAVFALETITPQEPIIEAFAATPRQLYRGGDDVVQLAWSVLGHVTEIQISEFEPEGACDLSLVQNNCFTRIDRTTTFVMTAFNGGLSASQAI
jgi:energy-coupling factor transporter ATP-binding protein EcfA2